MDLFNLKKVAHLEHSVEDLEQKLSVATNENVFYRRDNADFHQRCEKLEDLVAMMDDEIEQVAKGRYVNKYMKVHDHDATKLFKVTCVEVKNGKVQLMTREGISVVDGQVSISTANDCFPAYRATLSHIKTTCEIIKASEYKTYVANQA